VFWLSILETSCYSVRLFQMRSSDDEASTELGACGATQLVSPMPEHESESDDADEEDVGKKKWTLKKDLREWERVATIQKGEAALHDPQDIKQLIYEAAKKVMEDSGLIRLATNRPKPSDLHLWKQRTSWDADENTTRTTIYYCPLLTKFGCTCQLKVTDTRPGRGGRGRATPLGPPPATSPRPSPPARRVRTSLSLSPMCPSHTPAPAGGEERCSQSSRHGHGGRRFRGVVSGGWSSGSFQTSSRALQGIVPGSALIGSGI
jgi:hypothetical protein